MHTIKNEKKKSSSFLFGEAVEGLVFVYITVKNKSEAEIIGRELLEARLAACVNIFGNMSSLYRWKGKIQQETEAVLIAKTAKKLFGKLSEKVKSIHSYSCPCILQISVTDGNKEYINWLLKEVK